MRVYFYGKDLLVMFIYFKVYILFIDRKKKTLKNN